MSVQSVLTTSLVGGTISSLSADLYFVNSSNHQFILNDAPKSVLNTTHPIKNIDISCGWIVDGVTITYQVAGTGGSSVLSHGSVFSPPSSSVAIGATEIVAAVFGRAGYQTYYEREMINNVGFVIFDTDKATTRIAGPFGNGDNSNQGAPFYASDVLAFGSFAVPGSSALGLSGLFFYTDSAN
ncbi:uncharacterized protein BXZ73DRAFT_106876 [Epithele typhae]|uniref:uncharacterized protein n=1 Tax=Epithele typhae TaxID=378194 RepID=UPI0020078AF6|nr:uncharacterized protein BXZ73DRAFT_106876 [Epithele typhae]KAH9913697.1 hypothetical protein BXZ73DRAFT_106876 [Epithele typhae]